MKEQPEEIKLSEEQERVIVAFRAGKNLLVTGSAGTGKSTLLRAMQEHAGGRLPVTATTGIAAVVVGGMTIHSWSGVGIAKESPKTLANRILDRKGEPLERLRNFNRLAIDEISMMSRHLFDKLEEVFRLVRKDPRPFGGMQLVLFGDFLQLPPVTRDEKDDTDRFCFSSDAWKLAEIETHMLTKVFRQQDEEFSGALNDIRVGKLSEVASRLLNSRYGRRAVDTMPDIKAVTVFTHNEDVEAHNMTFLAQIEGESQFYNANDAGNQAQIETLRKNCLAPTLLELKIGAQVMLLKNLDPLSGFANGSIGVVTGFNKHSKEPEVKFSNGHTRTLSIAKWEIKDGQRILATRHQIPLRLAWAITVHKSQGMTLDKIDVHLGRVFEDGQAYVALSRVKTLQGLFIKSGGKEAIRANAEALHFYGH